MTQAIYFRHQTVTANTRPIQPQQARQKAQNTTDQKHRPLTAAAWQQVQHNHQLIQQNQNNQPQHNFSHHPVTMHQPHRHVPQVRFTGQPEADVPSQRIKQQAGAAQKNTPARSTLWRFVKWMGISLGAFLTGIAASKALQAQAKPKIPPLPPIGPHRPTGTKTRNALFLPFHTWGGGRKKAKYRLPYLGKRKTSQIKP